MSSDAGIYGLRSCGQRHGDVFTSPIVVSYMLDSIGYTADKDLSDTSILEPSCGEGEFLIEIAHRLSQSAATFGFDFRTAFERNVYAYDIDSDKLDKCRERLYAEGFSISDDAHIICADFLKADLPLFDCIVGNPPYIRYEQIPDSELQTYKSLFKTFHYRADLYVLFFEKTLMHLKEGGRHCFICANRWLKNEYGKKLRKLVASSFNLESIISLEKAKDAFQDEVLAYPAITLISRNAPGQTFKYAEIDTVRSLNDLSYASLPAPASSDWSGIFNRIDDDTLLTIEDMGFIVGIGVATGADAVFISKELPSLVENELLLPALNARDISGNSIHWSGKYLLNPYKPNGDLIDLSQYPKAAAYLVENREQLQNRHVAKKHPARWYKTIDRIVPGIKDVPKILLPDISGNTMIFVDPGKFYPQHNIYYIAGGSLEQLQLLSAMLMSDFVRNQLLSITNCMNGGYPRWQSQYLRKLVMPDVKSIGEELSSRMLDAYRQSDVDGINAVMKDIVRQPRKKNGRTQQAGVQLSFGF